MTILNIVDLAAINYDTTVIVQGDDSVLKNRIGILDDNRMPYLVKSIELTSSEGTETTVPILVEGKLSSSRLYDRVGGGD